MLPGDLPVCLLGLSFLIANEAQIDFKESRIRLNQEYFFLDKTHEDWSSTPDKDLSEQAFLVNTISKKGEPSFRKEEETNSLKELVIRTDEELSHPGTQTTFKALKEVVKQRGLRKVIK